MDAQYTVTTGEPDTGDELEIVIARIKAHGVGRHLPLPSPEGIAAFQAHAGQERPMSGVELEGHERLWRLVDAETESLDSTPPWKGGSA